MLRHTAFWLRSALLLGTLPAAAAAHDPGLSAARLRLAPATATLEIALHHEDLGGHLRVDTDADGAVSAAELDRARPSLAAWIDAGVRLTVDGETAHRGSLTVDADGEGGIAFRLAFQAEPARSVALALDLFAALPRGHRQLAMVHDTGGSLLGEALLRAGAHDLSVACTPTAVPARLAQGLRFFRLGIEHILIGHDHILFLLALLAAARRLASVAAIITAFTVAHSVTLALASLGVVALPGHLVEPVIALSIVWVAVSNLVHREPAHRCGITFAFGLVHGFGFASVLGDLGFGGPESGIAVPLLAFNTGVEAGQLAIAAVALPLLRAVQRSERSRRRSIVVLSAAAAALGAWWLVERTLLA